MFFYSIHKNRIKIEGKSKDMLHHRHRKYSMQHGFAQHRSQTTNQLLLLFVITWYFPKAKDSKHFPKQKVGKENFTFVS